MRGVRGQRVSDKAAGWNQKEGKSEEAGRKAGRGELAPAKVWKKNIV